MEQKLVSITMPTFDRLDFTKRTILSLHEKTKTPSYYLTVVDNGSKADTVEFLEECLQKGIIHKLIKNRRNMGVSVAVNQGWEEYPAEYYCKIDNDIEILHEDWLNRLIAIQKEENLSLASYCFFARHKVKGKDKKSSTGVWFNQSCVIHGGLVILPKKTVEELGYWNEDYSYGWEDPEYSFRAYLTKRKMALIDRDGYVEHLGLDPEDDEVPNDLYFCQKRVRAVSLGYEGLYSLNTLMFEQGFRPMKVSRKFMASQDANGYYIYRVNPEYMDIVKKQNFLRKEVIEELTAEKVVLKKGLTDISFLKDT